MGIDGIQKPRRGLNSLNSHYQLGYEICKSIQRITKRTVVGFNNPTILATTKLVYKCQSRAEFVWYTRYKGQPSSFNSYDSLTMDSIDG